MRRPRTCHSRDQDNVRTFHTRRKQRRRWGPREKANRRRKCMIKLRLKMSKFKCGVTACNARPIRPIRSKRLLLHRVRSAHKSEILNFAGPTRVKQGPPPLASANSAILQHRHSPRLADCIDSQDWRRRAQYPVARRADSISNFAFTHCVKCGTLAARNLLKFDQKLRRYIRRTKFKRRSSR